MGKGKDYELEMVKQCHQITDEAVWATRPDFSGNSKYAFADIALVYPNNEGHCHGSFVELKKRSAEEGKRSIIMSGSSKGQSGLEELEELIEMTPEWGDPIVAIKFDHRELIVCDAVHLHSAIINPDSAVEIHGARLTPSDSISMVKPTLEAWESSTAGKDDHVKLLEYTAVPDQYWKPVVKNEIDTTITIEG